MNLTQLKKRYKEELSKKELVLEKQKEKLEVYKKNFEDTLSDESCMLLVKQREAVKIVQAQIAYGNRLVRILEKEIEKEDYESLRMQEELEREIPIPVQYC